MAKHDTVGHGPLAEAYYPAVDVSDHDGSLAQICGSMVLVKTLRYIPKGKYPECIYLKVFTFSLYSQICEISRNFEKIRTKMVITLLVKR